MDGVVCTDLAPHDVKRLEWPSESEYKLEVTECSTGQEVRNTEPISEGNAEREGIANGKAFVQDPFLAPNVHGIDDMMQTHMDVLQERLNTWNANQERVLDEFQIALQKCLDQWSRQQEHFMNAERSERLRQLELKKGGLKVPSMNSAPRGSHFEAPSVNSAPRGSHLHKMAQSESHHSSNSMQAIQEQVSAISETWNLPKKLQAKRDSREKEKKDMQKRASRRSIAAGRKSIATKLRVPRPSGRPEASQGSSRFGSVFMAMGSLFHTPRTSVNVADSTTDTAGAKKSFAPYSVVSRPTTRDQSQANDSHGELSEEPPRTSRKSRNVSVREGSKKSKELMSAYTFVQDDEQEDTITMRERLQDIVISPWFDLFSGVVIVINSIIIGFETEYVAASGEENDYFYVGSILFNTWYVCELTMRLTAEGTQFFSSSNARWNIFDLVLVSLSLIEFFVELVVDGGWAVMGRLMRTLRVLRVVRTLRIMRILRYIREFRKMIYSITASLQTLCWSLFLLGMMMYMFAVFFTQGVMEWVQDKKGSIVNDKGAGTIFLLEDKYGTLARSMYSLYMSISGGVSWGIVADPLVDVHWIFMAFFLVFISISVFGVLNILTSVFVESAMMSANHYKDLLIQEKLHDKEIYAKHMKAIFNKIDTDHSGSISAEELECFLEDHHLRLYLEALDLDLVETRSLFSLLDRDESGEVSIDEFCQGCLRLKGEAKSFDIHCLLYENQRMVFKWKEFFKFTEEMFEKMDHLCYKIRCDIRDFGHRHGGSQIHMSEAMSTASSYHVAPPLQLD